MKKLMTLIPVLGLALVAVGCTEKPSKEIGESAATDSRDHLEVGQPDAVVLPDAIDPKIVDVAVLTQDESEQAALKKVRLEVSTAEEGDLEKTQAVLKRAIEVLSADPANASGSLNDEQKEQAKMELEYLNKEQAAVTKVLESLKNLNQAQAKSDQTAKELARTTDPSTKLDLEEQLRGEMVDLQNKKDTKAIADSEYNALIEERVKSLQQPK